MHSQSWKLFDDPRFDVLCNYPNVLLDGTLVECVEEDSGNVLTIHFYTEDRSTVYFEVSKFSNADARQRYNELRAQNAHSSAVLQVGEWQEAQLTHQRAGTFSLRRGALIRQVYLVQYGSNFYRITYDPRSEVNQQILATIQFRSASTNL